LVQRFEMLEHRRRIDRTGHPEGPGERPAPLRELGAPDVGVQPRTSTGCPMPRVRHDWHGIGWIPRCDAGRVRRHDDAKQLGGRSPLPTPDAGSNRPLWVLSPQWSGLV
jgi:hypothetical protein